MNNVKDIVFIKQFGANLQLLRKSKNMSQEALAFSSDIPISQIGRIERGEINTTISTIKAISKSLDISVKDLFNFEN
jgi:transcriptional regulator with XRE-family HTH domain